MLMQSDIKFEDSTLKSNLTKSLINEIGLAIVTGRYSDNGKIPSEKELSDRYGVSRIVVREATKYLTAKQMLFARRSQGTLIHPEKKWNLYDRDVLGWLTKREFSLELLRELNEIRASIEPAAASLAAKKVSAVNLQNLQAVFENMKRASESGGNLRAMEIRFHQGILKAAENRCYVQFSSIIECAVRYQYWSLENRQNLSNFDLNVYGEILKHIFNEDAKNAASAMRGLISSKLLVDLPPNG